MDNSAFPAARVHGDLSFRDQMTNFNKVTAGSPMGCEQIRHEPPMAFFRARLRTQQRQSGGPRSCVHLLRHASLLHFLQKSILVGGPILALAIAFQQFRRGSKEGFVRIANLFQGAEKKRKIRVLGEARKLPSTILPYINQLLDACAAEQSKELFRCFAGEADGAKKPLHLAQ